jgi:glycosyltransferase involved in cell wall biosynthesis
VREWSLVVRPIELTMRHAIVMITTSYPRFPGDGVGSFIEPIAKGIAARGHDVHLVAPWHPQITRQSVEDGVRFHFFRYAPTDSLTVFGYATGLRADTALKPAAWAVTPLAVLAGWRMVRRVAAEIRATVIHAHWVIPGGVLGALARGGRPLVVSAHGSDIFVAERVGLARRAARYVLDRSGWITACSDDLRDRAIALGAPANRTETVPYGVDTIRFAPGADVRRDVRARFGLGDAPVVVAAGRLVRKKGFEYLIDAAGELAREYPSLRVLIAGEGDLAAELAVRAARVPAVKLIGRQDQDAVAALAAAADAFVVPSVHDEAGNVDGLPNVALEAMAAAAPMVATTIGGLPQVIDDGVTGRLVPEKNVGALADAIGGLLRDPERARTMGAAARRKVERDFSWATVAARFEATYARARGTRT